MPGHSTTYYDKLIADHSTNIQPWTPPATLFVALTTTVLTRTDTSIPSGVELVGVGYARASITNGAAFWGAAVLDAASGRMTSSSLVDVVFANATDDWPPIPGWAVTDNPISGNVLWSGAFDDQVGLVSSGQTPLIAAGLLQIEVAGE
jgi:hypothetical protein